MGIPGSLAQAVLAGSIYLSSIQIRVRIPTVQPTWSYRWNRLSSRMHRLRVMFHSKGFAAVLRKLAPPPAQAALAPATTAKTPCVARPAHGRLLFVDATTPRPDRDSGSLRSLNIMKRLLESGYAVDFLPDDGVHAGGYATALQSLGVTLHSGLPANAHPRWFAGHGKQFDAVVVSRHHVASCWIPLVRRVSPTTRIIFDTVDLHHLRERREAELAGNKALLRCAQATQRRELENIAAADVTWVVSPVEKELLETQLPGAHVEVVANLHDVHAEAATDREREGVLFIGGGNHPPNIDAVRWLLTDIHPLVRKHLPASRLHVVGEGVEEKIAGLPGSRDGIVFHGHVPDLTALLSTARVGVAPLRFGAGVKGKVNQYMAHGLPTVATDCAVEGMHLTDRHDVLVANDPIAFARAVVELHEDREAWARLSSNGLANVRAHFSPASADAAFATTFGIATTRED